MKKLVLAGAIALFGLSNAQIAKGTVYVSGQLGFSQESNNNTDKKVSEINIIPTVGYFVNTNLAVGVGVGYKNQKTTTEVNTINTIGNITTATVGKTKDINNAIVVEPFVRKYWTLGDKLYIFGQLSVPMEFGSGKDKVETTTTVSSSTGVPATSTTTTSTSIDKAKSTSIGVTVKPGLDYFLNKNWTIEATIGEFGYNNFKYNTDGAKSVDNYNFGLNLSTVTIGVKYVFSK